jgi:hypothetical protein
MTGYELTLGILALIVIGVVLGLLWWGVHKLVEGGQVAQEREDRQAGIKRAAEAEMARSRGPKVVEGKVRRELSPGYRGEMPGASRVGMKDLEVVRHPTPTLYDPLNPLNPISPISPFNYQDHGPSDCAPKYDGGVEYSGSPSCSSDSGSSSPSSND